ncbi:MAG: hypothetical protein HOV94_01895, partial [Saccharothrix sp.]|nr:hypothetical protein [Saccharothrix sp.]
MRADRGLLALLIAVPIAAAVPPATSVTIPAAAGMVADAVTSDAEPDARPTRRLHPVRELRVGDTGVRRPLAMAWNPRLQALVVASPGRLVVLGATGRELGAVPVAPAPEAGILAVDPASGTSSYLSDGRLVSQSADALTQGNGTTGTTRSSALPVPARDLRGAAFDRSGALWLLDGQTLVRSGSDGQVSRSPLRAAAGDALQGLAPWPARDSFLTYDIDAQALLVVDRDGSVTERLDLGSLDVQHVVGIAVAPSADSTDAPSTRSVYLADSGAGAAAGRIIEASFTSAAVAAGAVNGALVR